MPAAALDGGLGGQVRLSSLRAVWIRMGQARRVGDAARDPECVGEATWHSVHLSGDVGGLPSPATHRPTAAGRKGSKRRGRKIRPTGGVPGYETREGDPNPSFGNERRGRL